MAKQKLGPNQRKWLKALESGTLKQTRSGCLKTLGGCYCCLGVASEVLKTTDTEITKRPTEYAFDGHTSVAPPFVIEALHLYGHNGERDDGGVGCLTELNDNGKSFKAIAALIRKDPSVYFKKPA